MNFQWVICTIVVRHLFHCGITLALQRTYGSTECLPSDVISWEVTSDSFSEGVTISRVLPCRRSRFFFRYHIHIWHPKRRFEVLSLVFVHPTISRGASMSLYFERFSHRPFEVSMLRLEHSCFVEGGSNGACSGVLCSSRLFSLFIVDIILMLS